MTKQTAEDLANARVSYEWADAADLAKYRALGEMLAALVAPQLDADVARAVAAELDARDTDHR